MNNRLKKLRIALNLSQEEFGKKIGIKSRAHISALETATRNITDRIISDICKEFNVNEEWLRFGTGEMFLKKTKSEEISDFLEDVLKDDESFKRKLVEILAKLDQKDWEDLERIAKKFINEKQKEEEQEDINKEVESYRKELELEKFLKMSEALPKENVWKNF